MWLKPGVASILIRWLKPTVILKWLLQFPLAKANGLTD